MPVSVTLPVRLFIFVSAMMMLEGCAILQQKSKAPLQEGVYKMKVDRSVTRVYVDMTQDSVKIYPLVMKHHDLVADSVLYRVYLFPAEMTRFQEKKTFYQPTMDIDVLTIPFKFRPATAGFPPQFNSNLNGAFYYGRRVDYYTVSYDRNPLGHYLKSTKHFAYGYGIFAGLGSTAINEYVTNNQVNVQYDGLVFTKGFAGIVGIGHLTFGIALGFDNLLDKNYALWYYQGKPWIGLTIGLNLN